MCGRFTLLELPPLSQRFGLQLLEDAGRLQARFNIAPSQDIATIVETEDGRSLRWMEWGYHPSWFKTKPGQPPPINARAETLLERPMFRSAVKAQRCIIPADGFYEWKAISGQRRKQPMYIKLKNQELFGFAGLYTARPGATDEEWIESCAIVTTKPNELMVPIHNRMPVILSPDVEALWLDPSVTEPAEVMSLLRPYDSALMEAYAVSELVNSVRNDRPELIIPERSPR